MDEELRIYLESMEARLIGDSHEAVQGLQANLERMQARLMAQINDASERLLDRLNNLERDFVNAKDFLVSDASVSSRRWIDLEERVTRLEQKVGE